MSLETAQKVIVPQKKNLSRIFLNSGTLIVIADINIKIVSGSATSHLILFNYLHEYYLDFLYLGRPSADFLLMVSWPRGLRPSCHTSSMRIVVQKE
jgi:hypothetical protein